MTWYKRVLCNINQVMINNLEIKRILIDMYERERKFRVEEDDFFPYQ